MKKFNPAKLLFGFLGLATFASLVGTVSGSLAWYAYSTRASLSYTGTSVERTAQLQIGVVSSVQIDYSGTSMAEDETLRGAGEYYYFAPIGVGLSSSVINTYLEKNGYATNYLIPTTSGAYTRGDAFSLKKAPNIDTGFIKNDALAPQTNYASIKFVFRIAESAYSATTGYVGNQDIWLTDSTTQASAGNSTNVYKALRIYINRDDSQYADDFIFNPSSASASAGQTKVGGLLDIGGDGYYDYGATGEILYGECDDYNVGKSDTAYDGVEELIDINGSNSSELDTFTAKHKNGVKYYNSLNSNGVKTAAYETLATIAPKKVDGVLSNNDPDHPTSVCKTAATGSKLARVDMTIYLEGWDFSAIDKEVNHLFDLGLTFEINKVSAQ